MMAKRRRHNKARPFYKVVPKTDDDGKIMPGVFTGDPQNRAAIRAETKKLLTREERKRSIWGKYFYRWGSLVQRHQWS